MDTTPSQWLAELAVSLDQYDVSLSPKSLSSCTTNDFFNNNDIVDASQLCFERPAKLLKTGGSWGSSNTNNEHIFSPNYMSSSSSTSPQYFMFENSNASVITPQLIDSKELGLKPKVEDDYELMANHVTTDQSYEIRESHGSDKKRVRSSKVADYVVNIQDHVAAERRRREKLSERLIALSALIPGLKKMDKASVLGDAVKYLKNLQERVRTLEVKAKQRSVIDSVSLVKKSFVFMDDDGDATSLLSKPEILSSNPEDVALPEIEARVLDKEVLLRIYCEKKFGLIGRILSELEQLHLSVTSSNSLAFGSFDVVITLTAQMKANCNITTKDLVKRLRTVF